MEESTNWLPGIVVLSIGLVAGLVLAWKLGKGAPARKVKGRQAKASRGERTSLDLLVRRDALVRQLRELDDVAGKLAPDELARQRYALELEAAEVLRSLDHAGEPTRGEDGRGEDGRGEESAPDAAPATGGGWLKSHPGVIGVVAGIAGAGFVIFLQQLITENSSSRNGGTMTGNNSPGGAPMGAPARGPAMGGAEDEGPDPELDALRAAVAAHPESIEAKLDLAQLLIFKDKLVDAFQVSREILAVEPDNARALTYSAVVRLAMGQGQGALELSARAVAKDPTLVEGWFHRGLIAYQLERFDLAVEAWERALVLRPDGAQAIGQLLEDARTRAKGGPAAAPGPAGGPAPASGPVPPGHPPLGGNPGGPVPAAGTVPPGHPPMGGSPGGPGPVSPGPPPMAGDPAPGARPGMSVALGTLAAGTGVGGTIALDPGARVAPGAVLFISARPDGVRAGPPAAVKRIQAPTFPMAFTLGPEDSMVAGLPWPEKATIDVRIDSDGVANTRDPNDPTSRSEGVQAGERGLALVLRLP